MNVCTEQLRLTRLMAAENILAYLKTIERMVEVYEVQGEQIKF